MTKSDSLFSCVLPPDRACHQVHTILIRLIDRLDASLHESTSVIRWGAPILYFGDFGSSRVATLGLNPSNREFVDEAGNELNGTSRRFHTLRSLGLGSWSDTDADHIHLILESCRAYFRSNPYDRWFKRLDEIVSGTGASFYDREKPACHLDLIPYATECKWTDLAGRERSRLLEVSVDALANLLADSSVEVLILNGQSVVNQFQALLGVELERVRMPSWDLPRNLVPVRGYAYLGRLEEVSDVPLSTPIAVLGYNHNLQSSFGVTNDVIQRIKYWVANNSKLNEYER